MISNEIVIVCFKICASVHTTAELKVIRNDVTPKAVNKTIQAFGASYIAVPTELGALGVPPMLLPCILQTLG